ncbi:Calreticulin/calnexin [Trema orientale]|uniref:Calreticulin/calnexin n=1 Tax=Trema orientale TaxID=63057 RepID=A0A2P5F1T5_TREOI|nr:Calreticulin/calnexin [Trema orientale]
MAMAIQGRKMRIYGMMIMLLSCFAFRICSSFDAIFYESFEDSFEGHWIVSEKDDYNGVWKLSKSEGHDDHGLLFEVRLQNVLECGGAYLKYLRPQDAGWKAKEFDNESLYSIMFGPDKYGSTNKVHFILKHKNPKNGEYVEHHLKNSASVPSDKLTHVYTALLTPDNELRILVDDEEKKKANFLSSEDFEPPLIPGKTISDPNDYKPEDWDE